VHTVLLQLDQDEELRLTDDRKGNAIISQPYRPDAVVALPDRSLGELIGEELRRLDSDEPYSEALEAATGVTGLADHPGTREHVWFDPMRPAEEAGAPESDPEGTAGTEAPTVPADSRESDEVAEAGEHDAGEHGADQPDADRAVTG
jgi:hypothetical protein